MLRCGTLPAAGPPTEALAACRNDREDEACTFRAPRGPVCIAAYICFGKCTSVDGVDVHGAGAQRSDPKSGNPDRYRSGLGGQLDEVRIRNYVRCVRDAD